MKAYSEDLRKKIVEAVGRGTPKSEVARAFGVGLSSVKRYVAAAAREGRPLAPKRRPGSKPKVDEGARRLLEADLEERPAAATLPQRREFLRRMCGWRSATPRSRGCSSAWGGPEKRLGASERDEFLRAAWCELVAGTLDAGRFVFVDEMGANVSLAPLYAWSRKGERAFGRAPRNWGKNVTLLASMTREGMGPCVAVEGATTGAVFEA